MPWVGDTLWAWWPLSMAAGPGGQPSSGPQQPIPRPAISWEQLTLKSIQYSICLQENKNHFRFINSNDTCKSQLNRLC